LKLLNCFLLFWHDSKQTSRCRKMYELPKESTSSTDCNVDFASYSVESGGSKMPMKHIGMIWWSHCCCCSFTDFVFIPNWLLLKYWLLSLPLLLWLFAIVVVSFNVVVFVDIAVIVVVTDFVINIFVVVDLCAIEFVVVVSEVMLLLCSMLTSLLLLISSFHASEVALHRINH